MTSPDVVPYGAAPSQVLEVLRPEGPPRGTAVLLHGGWWRDRHDRTLMDPLADRLTSRGWLVVNVEYRRTGSDGGGWPQTFEDAVAALAAAPLRARPVVAVGHSAGGHLALLLASEPVRPFGVIARADTPNHSDAGMPRAAFDGVVALAPVTDLQASDAAGLGEDATALFLRGAGERGSAARHAAYREASPLHHALDVPALVVHGDADARVPLAQSRAYTATHPQARLHEVPGGDHFCVIDPAHPAWAAAEAWMEDLAPPQR